MNTNDLYYKKYLKYKSKYFELKGGSQIGDVLKPCPSFKLGKTPYVLAKEYNCTYDESKDKFKDFTYTEFLAVNRRHSIAQITINELKDKGFPLDFFLDRGYPREILVVPYIDKLKDGYSLFTLEHFRKANCTVEFLRTKMYTIYKLILIGFPASEIRDNFTTEEIINAIKNISNDISLLELKNLGFTLNELIKWHNPCDFKNTEYTLQELKIAGFTTSYLRLCYNIVEFRSAGYTIKDLLIFSYDDLLSNGFTAQEILDAITIEHNNDKYSYDNIRSVQYFKMKGISAAKLKEKGFNIIYFKEAGFSVKDLRSAGFTLAELKTGGFSASELRSDGFTLAELKTGEFSASELRSAKFGVDELKSAGFGVTVLKSAGYTVPELKEAGFSVMEINGD
jgi:hypothetical protein